MSIGFDPYHRWLGIPAEEQPAHHYRLLAIRAFESDPDVIQNAADQRMAHLRHYQAGRHAELCARILNELAAAKVCLLDRRKKAAYDEQLRRALAGQGAAPVPLRAVPVAAPAPPPMLPPEAAPADSGLVRLFSRTGRGATVVSARAAARRRSHAGALAAFASVALLLAAGAAIVVFQPAGGGDGANGAPSVVETDPAALPRDKPHLKERPSGEVVKDQWTDLLRWVELREDRVSGSWARQGDVVRAKAGPRSWLMLPVALEAASYELEAAFTRNAGDGAVCVGVPVGSRYAVIALSARQGETSIVGAGAPESPRPGHPSPLENDRPYSVLVSVSVRARDARIEVLLDGRPHLRWAGPVASLAATPTTLPDPLRPVIGADEAAVAFTSVRMRLGAGRATWVEHGVAGPSKQPTTPHAPDRAPAGEQRPRTRPDPPAGG